MRDALVVLLATVVAAVVVWPGVARADGDPASDTLLEQDVFYPYSSTASPAAQNRLNAEVAATHRAGIDLKVAVVAQSVDLGSVTALYRKPQSYARFLDVEISYQHRVPLVVVMPNGFGVVGLSPAVASKITRSPPPSGASGTELTDAVSTALAHALSGVGRAGAKAAQNGSGSGSGRTLLLLILILAAVVVAGILIVLRFVVPAREQSTGQAPGGKL